MTKANTTPVVSIMPATNLKAIIAEAIRADVKAVAEAKEYGKTYAQCASALRAGIPSGETCTKQFDEYRRRVNAFAQDVARARVAGLDLDDEVETIARHVKTINAGIARDNKLAAWVSPTGEKSEGEIAVQLRKKVANKKAKQRAVNKIVKDLKAKSPKADNDELVEKAKELVKAGAIEKREAEKTAANEGKLIEQLAAFSLKLGEVFDADIKQEQLQLAAIIASLKEKQTKA